MNFKFEAGTSRGTLTYKDIYIIQLSQLEYPEISGYGECSPLVGLSIDHTASIGPELDRISRVIRNGTPDISANEDIEQWVDAHVPVEFPSVRFGLETAFNDLQNGGRRCLFTGGFVEGKKSIPINGLIWMGDYESMARQVWEKILEKFLCIKIKVGTLDLKTELKLIEFIRSQDPDHKIEIRLDANGAYHPREALAVLEQFSKHDIHSIEQPIKPGHEKEMAEICRSSPIPIALDEELIGVNQRDQLLETIQPQYIIVKPTLLGGFAASREWIKAAKKFGAGWWMTSALESNIGLNAIAQFADHLNTTLPQGLGTGRLFLNNFPSPLKLDGDQLFYDMDSHWDLSALHNH